MTVGSQSDSQKGDLGAEVREGFFFYLRPEGREVVKTVISSCHVCWYFSLYNLTPVLVQFYCV